MSMIGILLRVPGAQLEAFLKDSSLLDQHVEALDTDDESQLDLHKAWDGINFLLTGNGINTMEEPFAPLSRTIFSGQILDWEQDMGYGPAQYLEPEQVKEVDQALRMVSVRDLHQRYNADAMNKQGVYPQPWSDSRDERDWLADMFEQMKAFYAKAAQEDQAVITYIT